MGWSVFLPQAMLFLYPFQALKLPKLVTFVIYSQNLQYYPGSWMVLSNLALPLKTWHCSLPLLLQVEAQKAKIPDWDKNTLLESAMTEEKNNDSNNINAKGLRQRNYLCGKLTTINKHLSALLHHVFSWPDRTPFSSEARVPFLCPHYWREVILNNIRVLATPGYCKKLTPFLPKPGQIFINHFIFLII